MLFSTFHSRFSLIKKKFSSFVHVFCFLNAMDAIPRTCKICLETDPADELISPCRCRGGMKYIHRSCLEHWRNSNIGQSFYRCEVCHYRYQFRRIWWARVLQSRWTSRILSALGLTTSVCLSGYYSARVINWLYYSLEDNPTLLTYLPHRLQVLFYGLFWVSIPGFYMFVNSLSPEANRLPSVIRFPYLYWPWSQIHFHSSSTTVDEEKESDSKTARVKRVPYNSPCALSWSLVILGAMSSTYYSCCYINDLCENKCARVQQMIENIQEE